MTGSLLVAGTTSDAGKSVVTTGLCRAFARRGLRVAPFKSQNMSNNSMVVAAPRGGAPADGGSGGAGASGIESIAGRADRGGVLPTSQDWLGAEIGRAQWIQALAAGAEPEVAMNPVLLKPGSDRRSHVVVMGRPAGEISSSEFVGGRTHLAEAAYAAYDDLASRYDVVVAEGAGSPAEINLRAGDYVNMGLAQHAQIPTVVVGDIDRGGVFAAMYGTLALLDDADQVLVAGFVVNKFRGDETLLRPGLEALERRTQRPVYGVLPWSPEVWLDSEDALELDARRSTGGEALKVAVVRLPRISNFTDLDALGIEPGLDVVFAATPAALADADVIVLPGTRATIADLAWLRRRGLDRAILDQASAGRAVLGICGGFQMLGRTVSDPDGVEGERGAVVDGLGLLDVTTTFGVDKALRLPHGRALGVEASGYEIHHGRIARGDDEEFLGGARRGRVFGTMWHGSLEGDALRDAFLREVSDGAVTSSASFPARREARLELLGDLVERHLDVDALLTLVREGSPR